MPFGFNDNDDVTIKNRDILRKIEYLVNGSSNAMNVNGSSSLVNFSYSPASDESFYLEKLIFFLSDGGGNNLDRFGDLNAIVKNGVLITCKSKNIVQNIFNMKDNIDIMLVFPEHKGATPLMSAKEVNCGTMSFNPPLILNGATTDYIRIVVRDNLTALTYMRAVAVLFKIN